METSTYSVPSLNNRSCVSELCTSQFQNRPSSLRAIPGHLIHVKLLTVGNLTHNEARLVGHLAFVLKRASAIGNKRI